ncbi:proteic killer suppression protein [Oxalobacteraceae bacterium GrIS 2.11]
MSYQLRFTQSYENRAKKFLKCHPEVVRQYQKTLEILEVNPFHPSLRLQALQGRLAGLHSVSINISYRITLEFIIADSTIIPVDVGDHDHVY